MTGRLFGPLTAAGPGPGALPGCRLQRLEVLNWGTFHAKVWSLDLALLARRRHREASLLVRSPGSSGTPGAALARTALTTAAAAGAALVGVVVITRR